MTDSRHKKERAFPLLLTVVSYVLLGSFVVCFLLDHFYFSDFDVDWGLRVAYGQVISLGGLFLLWIGFIAYKFFHPETT
jgi:protein-S-isoprenylcysteine O-methyltransferase Ste14